MPRLIGGIARTAVIAGTATAVSNRVSRRQAGRWAQQEEAQAYEQGQAPQPQVVYAAPPSPAPAAPAPAAPADEMDTRLAQLKELAELKAQGILTDAEFETQKSRILNG